MKPQEYEAEKQRVERYDQMRGEIEFLENAHRRIATGQVGEIRVVVSKNDRLDLVELPGCDFCQSVARNILDAIEAQRSKLARKMEAL